MEKVEARTCRLAVRVSQTERSELESSARNAQLTLSDYLRARILGKRVRAVPRVPEVNLETYRELARLHSNLNQLTRHLNEGRILEVDGQEMLRALRIMYKHVAQLRLDLLAAASVDEEDGGDR